MDTWFQVAAAMAANGNSRLLARWLRVSKAVATARQQPQADVMAQRFWPGLQEIPARITARYYQLLRDEQQQAHWLRLQEQGWQLLLQEDAGWPSALSSLPDMPGLLFVCGDSDKLQQPTIAMVGARHASLEGRRIAKELAQQLASSGFVVVSGLALGIDGAAHEGAQLQGQTIAVLGQGPGTPCYPARHRSLARQIVENGGALVTEFPTQLGPRREFFPQRNRLISGLSHAVVVVEAAIQSGSLITARLAAEQGREVFAVPGSIRNPLSRGCHQLLKEGAHWLEEVADIAQVLKQEIFFSHQLAMSPEENLTAESPLLAWFVSGVNSVEQLQQHSGLALEQLLVQLSQLELAGQVMRVSGGYCRC